MAQWNRRDYRLLACELLLIVAAREHAWVLLPEAMQGAASKGMGAAMALVFLSVIHRLAVALGKPSRAFYAVLCLAVWYSLQTLICSAWWLIEPWPVLPGQSLCSARVDIDLGAIGLMALAWIAYKLTTVRSSSNGELE